MLARKTKCWIAFHEKAVQYSALETTSDFENTILSSNYNVYTYSSTAYLAGTFGQKWTGVEQAMSSHVSCWSCLLAVILVYQAIGS